MRRHRPEFSRGEWRHFLIRPDELENLGAVEATIGVRNQGDGNSVDARKPRPLFR